MGVQRQMNVNMTPPQPQPHPRVRGVLKKDESVALLKALTPKTWWLGLGESFQKDPTLQVKWLGKQADDQVV